HRNERHDYRPDQGLCPCSRLFSVQAVLRRPRLHDCLVLRRPRLCPAWECQLPVAELLRPRACRQFHDASAGRGRRGMVAARPGSPVAVEVPDLARAAGRQVLGPAGFRDHCSDGRAVANWPEPAEFLTRALSRPLSRVPLAAAAADRLLAAIIVAVTVVAAT